MRLDLRLSRRDVLKTGGALAASVALSGCGRFAAPGETGQLVSSQILLPQRFTVPLPVLDTVPVTRLDGVDVAEIRQQPARLEILPGVHTDALTYGGTFPGPLLESRSGQPMLVRHHNDLPVSTVVHLHGGHTPASSDGYPTDLVQPGARREYAYPMDQRAATLWYHDHALDRTGDQVYRGLFGMHIVRDDFDDALPLPNGDRELPLVIVDRSFDEHGQFLYPTASGDASDGHASDAMGGGGAVVVDPEFVEGVLGDVMLVNGAPWPVLEVEAVRYRFRVLNGCNARLIELALDPQPAGGSAFVQVGSDGGLLAAPVAHNTLRVAQAERFDVVVDFSRYPVGTEVTVRNLIGSGSTADVMRFVVTRSGSDDSAPTDRLPALPELERLDYSAAPVRRWSFTRGGAGNGEGWRINDRLFDPTRMDARVRLGQVERWQFLADMHHPVHVHLDPFQVIRRGGGDPLPTDSGWKDTVSLAPGELVEVAVRFTTHTGPYLIHCHNLEHEDRMMMAAFETIT